MPRTAYLPALALLVLTFSACGRGDGLHRVEVHGSATFEGVPIERGLITFRPAPGSKGPAAGTGIVAGKFSIPTERGPTIGPHEVEVKIVSVASNPETPGDSAQNNRTPPQLKTFSQQVEVADGVNNFNFSFPPKSER